MSTTMYSCAEAARRGDGIVVNARGGHNAFGGPGCNGRCRMDTKPSRYSRRQFLARNAWAMGLIVAAGAPPPGAAPAPTTAAAAAPAAAQAGAPAGVFNVWFSANWNEVTDKAVGETFVE